MRAIMLPQSNIGPAPVHTYAKKLTMNGYLLFAIGLSVVGSGFLQFRINLGNLSIHPYLTIVTAMLPLLVISRFNRIPTRFMTTLVMFCGLYFMTTFQGITGASLAEGAKIGGSMATILTMMLLVNSWPDFVAGVTGLALAVGALAVIGIDTSQEVGTIQAIESANRNAYSLYALPPILMGGYILVQSKSDSMIAKLLIAGSLFASSLAIALNLNRSGWLGLTLVVAMLVYQKSIKAGLIVAVLGGITFYVVTTMFGTKHLEERMLASQSGLESDKYRWALIEGSIMTAINHPLLGVSPQELPYFLGIHLGAPGEVIYPHNVFVHMLGGSGFICFALMINVGAILWKWNIPRSLPKATQLALKEARTLSRMLLILWVVRGCFSHEIIYSPSFNMALGLCGGLCIVYSLGAGKAPKRSPDERR